MSPLRSAEAKSVRPSAAEDLLGASGERRSWQCDRYASTGA
jgi:hypothetical protein